MKQQANTNFSHEIMFLCCHARDRFPNMSLILLPPPWINLSIWHTEAKRPFLENIPNWCLDRSISLRRSSVLHNWWIFLSLLFSFAKFPWIFMLLQFLQEKLTFQFPHLVIKQVFARITQVHIFFDEILSVSLKSKSTKVYQNKYFLFQTFLLSEL